MSERATNLAALREREYRLQELCTVLDGYRVDIRQMLSTSRPGASGEEIDCDWTKAADAVMECIPKVSEARKLRASIRELKSELGIVS